MLRRRLADSIDPPTEFFQIEVAPGVALDAWKIEPPSASPEPRPLLVFVYGEPEWLPVVTGYLLLRWVGVARGRRSSVSGGEFMGSFKDAYRRWRMKRLRKKFESYYEKRSGGNGPGAVH